MVTVSVSKPTAELLASVIKQSKIRKDMMTYNDKRWAKFNGSLTKGDLAYFVPVDQLSLQWMRSMFDKFCFDEVFNCKLVFYCGWFVRRKRVTGQAMFHYDQTGTGKGRSIIVPLQEMHDDDPHLLIRTKKGDISQKYVFGEAAVNYDNTLHSAQPGVSSRPLWFAHFCCGEEGMNSEQARNAEAAVAETATVYFSHDGVVTNSDVIFYDSD